ncbi:3-oxoacyl-[acyl-carrier-protein] synthase III C-terminal domain-containing protein [Brevibacillus fulvus]|uniref:3-oxoacyl-[acyl-carrier-protein] synthase III n=1 Tax=Brevibacillus fulvus TaxID=1125967 RepID=A0A939BRH9_9BACL|nr:3-oxoacyl-[acyl-carrier-protein] synthase III C-terminal domain-containing protein [Brevibacillus fulvus]MBM7589637.1 3-oxoacyl-[acyl-carrier-protein] synthase III [Brevibacillus fulvus]
MIGMEAFATYVPQKRSSVKELATELSLSGEEQARLQEYGFAHVAVEPKRQLHHLLVQAAQLLFHKRPEIVSQIGAILCTHAFLTNFPYLFDPLTQLQQEYGLDHLPKITFAQMNCASSDLLLFLARRWLEAHPDVPGALLLIGDKVFIPKHRYLKDSTISGDAAAAVFLSRHAHQHRILHTSIQTEATVFNSVRSDPKEWKWFQATFPLGLVKIIRSSLIACRLEAEQLRWIFPNNINEVTWNTVAKALHLPREKFYYPTLSTVGHAQNVDNLLNLQAAKTNGLLTTGDYYATLSLGMGSAFGCTIFQF